MPTIELELTQDQIDALSEEMEAYNRKFDPNEPFTDLGEYIVFLLEVLERDVY